MQRASGLNGSTNHQPRGTPSELAEIQRLLVDVRNTQLAAPGVESQAIAAALRQVEQGLEVLAQPGATGRLVTEVEITFADD